VHDDEEDLVSRVIAAVDASATSPTVAGAAGAIAELLGHDLSVLHVAAADDASAASLTSLVAELVPPLVPAGTPLVVAGGDPITEIVAASRQPDVALVVIGSRSAPDDPRPAGHVATAIVEQSATPVLVVPPSHTPAALRRIVLPLEGSQATTDAISGVLAELRAAGVAAVVVHVLDDTTVPMFWDDPAHTATSYGREFRDRWCGGDVDVAIRRGAAGRQVLDVCGALDADLIALGWSQDLTTGHARVVRSILAGASVPVLLVPLPNH
jgi:nucleotide-binding universal stress UspA family protein